MNNWDFLTENTRLEAVSIEGVFYRVGNQVRLRPQGGGADIFDMVLTGQIATIEAIEQDLEDRIHFAVVLSDDPGKDLGMLRQPGHRFFFTPNEIELLAQDSQDEQ
jgi:hypothetical protein